jgi:predicted glycosyltransferase
MKRILIIENCNLTPHIETSFEIVKNHLLHGDEVYYYFVGSDLKPREFYAFESGFNFLLPHYIGSKHLKSRLFHFTGNVNLPSIDYSEKKFSSISQIRDFDYLDAKLGIGILSSLVFRINSDNFDINENNKLVNSFFKSAISLFDFTLNRIEKVQPDLMYTFNGRYAYGNAISEAARLRNIPIFFHERGCDIYHYWITEYKPFDVLKFEEECMETWNRLHDKFSAKEIGKNWFHKQRFGLQNTRYNYVNKSNIGNINFEIPNTKRIVVFFTSSEDEMIVLRDLLSWNRWESQEKAVLDLIEVCNKIEDIFLIIRIHPNMDNKEKSAMRFWLDLKDKYLNVKFVLPKDPVDSYTLMDKSNFVVTCGSTLSIESIFYGKPSICLGPNKYHKYFGKIIPRNSIELENILKNRQIIAVDSDRVLPYGYFMSTFGTKYLHYRADGAEKGQFLGVNLNRYRKFKVQLEHFERYKSIIYRFWNKHNL